jgi:4-oxalocrotonate tautomerase
MPHIEIKCFPGRTEEQKTLLANKLAEDAAEILGSKIKNISVVIQDVPKERWRTDVYEAQVKPNENCLYKESEFKG